MAQSLTHLTLGFGLGHDLMVCDFEPHIRLCVDSTEPAWDSLSLPLFLPLPCSCSLSLSLSQGKETEKKERIVSLKKVERRMRSVLER